MILDREKITDLTNCRKYYNPHLIDCYNAIQPHSLSKLSFAIFNTIIANKEYPAGPSEQELKERKRIYNNMPISANYLLEQCFTSKYTIDKKPIDSDKGNLYKRLVELSDLNIFHIWRCGNPFFFVCFLERDIGLWKNYNPSANLIPKTLYKVLNNAPDAIYWMEQFVKSNGQSMTTDQIEKSFSEFIDSLIQKMRADVADKLNKCEKSDNVYTYMSNLLKEIERIDPFEGLILDDTFLDRLPTSVRIALVTKKEKMNLEDILPKNKPPKKIRKRSSKSSVNAKLDPEVQGFLDIDPFKNCNNFISYYRAILKSLDSNVKFVKASVDRQYAVKALDILTDNDLNEISFLKGWIRHYYTNNLGGSKIKDPYQTSLKSFIETFKDYEPRYIK